MKITCKTCKQSWANNKEYANREKCTNDRCMLLTPNGAAERLQKIKIAAENVEARKAMQETIAEAKKQAVNPPWVDRDNPQLPPVNLHTMPPHPHKQSCTCTVCMTKEEHSSGKVIEMKRPTTPAANEVPAPKQARLKVKMKEQEVNSKESDDPLEASLFVRVEPVIVFNITKLGR